MKKRNGVATSLVSNELGARRLRCSTDDDDDDDDDDSMSGRLF